MRTVGSHDLFLSYHVKGDRFDSQTTAKLCDTGRHSSGPNLLFVCEYVISRLLIYILTQDKLKLMSYFLSLA